MFWVEPEVEFDVFELLVHDADGWFPDLLLTVQPREEFELVEWGFGLFQAFGLVRLELVCDDEAFWAFWWGDRDALLEVSWWEEGDALAEGLSALALEGEGERGGLFETCLVLLRAMFDFWAKAEKHGLVMKRNYSQINLNILRGWTQFFFI